MSHRGVFDGNSLENSLNGIRQALVFGIDFFEVDVRKGGDGELYLLHDKSLDRTTQGIGLLEEKSEEELSQILLKESGEPLPKFSQLLQFALNQEIYLMLDVKEPILPEVMEAVRSFGLSDRCLLLTFDRERATEALKISDEFLISVLVNNSDDLNFYQGLFSERKFLAYVSKDAPLDLFQLVRNQSIQIVTDVMGTVEANAQLDKGRSYLVFQEKRHASVIVSDFPILLQERLQK